MEELKKPLMHYNPDFDKIRPKENDPELKAMFDEINETIYGGRIPNIPIAWADRVAGSKSIMGGYCMDPENLMFVERSCILISREIVDQTVRNVVCHEMLHCLCHMQDVKHGIEVTSKKSNSYGNGHHEGLWKRLATMIYKRHGIRIDQYYVDTTKTALKNAHEENWKDDGEEYAYTFYKFEGSVMMQKIAEDSVEILDKFNFPIFRGRIEELNDVPPTKGNPFDDKNFSEKIASVYARHVDKYTEKEWNFISTGDTYHTGDGNKVEVLFAMR